MPTVTPPTTRCLANAPHPFQASGFSGAVTWTATGGSITAAGLWAAPASAGTYTITATSGGQSATATAVVYAPAAKSGAAKLRGRHVPRPRRHRGR